MSWSFHAVGKPEALKRALAKNAAGLSGLSKIEMDHAVPHLCGLLDSANPDFAVSVTASGYATADYAAADGSWVNIRNQNISVEIKQLGALVE